MFFRKIYQSLQSKVGLAIVIGLYFLLSFPLTTSIAVIGYATGEQLGKLISPIIITLVLSDSYKWTRSQKVLHIFLIAFLFEIMMSQRFLVPVVNLISLAALLTAIIQVIYKRIRPAKSKND